MTAKLFAGMYIGQMDFYHWQLERTDAVQQGYTRMSVGAGIQYDSFYAFVCGLLQAVYEKSFDIALTVLNRIMRVMTAEPVYTLLHRLATIYSGFPTTQPVQIRTVQYQKIHRMTKRRY